MCVSLSARTNTYHASFRHIYIVLIVQAYETSKNILPADTGISRQTESN
jgi:hypothetical protein